MVRSHAGFATRPWNIRRPVARGVSRLAARLWPFWESAKVTLDPWRDEQLPVRILRLLDQLVSDRIILQPVERAILAIAPFVREAVMSVGAKLLAEQDVETLNEVADAKPIRQALEAVHRGRPNLVRRAQWLAENGRRNDARSVAWWLAHRMLLRRTLLWVPRHKSGGELADDLLAALAPDPGNDYLQQALDPPRLLRVAKCIAAADRLLLPGSENLKQLRDNEAVRGTHPELIRETLLARLLHLAGWLALDPRHLDELVAEQIGAIPLTPSLLIETLSKLQWLSGPHERLRLQARARTLRLSSPFACTLMPLT
ncbi:HD domain-containing protein [Nannocystis pusilla]|uniref:HD domain-containing protein n=1 Tax=Nannocystis pusilla TaxID=889268 RepID=UPI003B7E56E4